MYAKRWAQLKMSKDLVDPKIGRYDRIDAPDAQKKAKFKLSDLNTDNR